MAVAEVVRMYKNKDEGWHYSLLFGIMYGRCPVGLILAVVIYFSVTGPLSMVGTALKTSLGDTQTFSMNNTQSFSTAFPHVGDVHVKGATPEGKKYFIDGSQSK